MGIDPEALVLSRGEDAALPLVGAEARDVLRGEVGVAGQEFVQA